MAVPPSTVLCICVCVLDLTLRVLASAFISHGGSMAMSCDAGLVLAFMHENYALILVITEYLPQRRVRKCSTQTTGK